MSKVTIAAAVLAGHGLGARLEELNLIDEQVAKLVGDLGGALGSIMDMVEKVDQAVAIVQRSTTEGDYDNVVEGLRVIKRVTEDLVSDQDKIMETLFGGMSKEEMQMIALLKALGIKL